MARGGGRHRLIDPANPKHVDPRLRLVRRGDKGFRQIGFSPRHTEQRAKRNGQYGGGALPLAIYASLRL
jgi:hypothetical protein